MMWIIMELPLVTILVVVASIQERFFTLKTVVGKGSMPTAIEHGWVRAKGIGSSNKRENEVFFNFESSLVYPES